MRPLLITDSAVPGRDVLLNPAEMRTRLEPALGPMREKAIRVLRVKYRPSQSLTVVYAIGNGSPAIVAGRTFPSSAATPSSTRSSADFDIPALQVAFWKFPKDRRLTHVGKVVYRTRGCANKFPGGLRAQSLATHPRSAP